MKYVHMPLEMSKVIICYSDQNLGQWLKRIQGQTKMHIEAPVKLFISFRFQTEVGFNRCNLMNLLKEITATIVYEGIIKNTQQLVEIGIEKVRAPESEVIIFFQQV